MDPKQVYHTGRYDIATDTLIGGEFAVLVQGRQITAKTPEELFAKVAELQPT